jgi:hypothetical protein
MSHVQWAPPSTHVGALQHIKPFHLYGIYCSHTCTSRLIPCVSHINTISPPRFSLNYQNQIRTFQVPHYLSLSLHYAIARRCFVGLAVLPSWSLCCLCGITTLSNPTIKVTFVLSTFPYLSMAYDALERRLDVWWRGLLSRPWRRHLWLSAADSLTTPSNPSRSS